MSRVLLSWIGTMDLKAAERDDPADTGPVAQAMLARSFDHVVLLNDWPGSKFAGFEGWLKKKTKCAFVVRAFTLTSPTHHRDIYNAVASTVAWVREKYGADAKLTFHVSPGTQAMAAIWIILAKTRFEAELIESSKDHGVNTVDVPFELSAEFIPAAVQQTSDDLARLAEGARPDEPKFGDILHRSPAMSRLVRRARQAAAFSEAVLIEGESGTGKQLFAEAIHAESPRRAHPFVEVNCGAIPRDLFESQFFGHMRGAFTSAEAEHKGFFEQADGGTLFLDEVGELALEHQVKLLRALQQKKVRRLNGKSDVAVDVRVIAATNRALLEEVKAGRFREDLFYRLAILSLKVPALRHREGDLGWLIDRLVERLNAELGGRAGAVQKKLSVGAKKLLLGHAWPGNVRELEASLRRAFIWSTDAVIETAEARDALLVVPGGGVERILGRPLGEDFNIEDVLTEVATHYLSRALADTHGNKTKAASLVGLASPQTFKNWMKTYRVET